MNKFIDITGEKFGRLTAITRAGYDKHRNILWNCICECGTETIVTGYALRRHTTQSCGCYRRETVLFGTNKKPHGNASLNKIFDSYKRSAKARKLDFLLSKSEFQELISSNCFYCNKKPAQQQNAKHTNGNIIYNGIDRLDNSNGYIIGNVIPSCFQCNHSKGTNTEIEFYTWVKSIYINLNLDKYN
jgi:hypothetical protein